MYNRKRVGDLQYLLLEKWEVQMSRVAEENTHEFTAALTDSEKILLQNFVRLESGGKWGRNVPVLIPKTPTMDYYNMIFSIRKSHKGDWFPEENKYFFTFPNSNRWIDAASVIQRYARQCGASRSQLLTSNRLRKHIATTTQILNLKQNEIDQLAKFMGHTTNTHEEFYK